ncbi:unnamed protein product [Fusarium graminearum]|uniref:Chromosome 2, complete genome n=2 Tax=Gibberella zeae TaxID=5518 RepID=A0A098DH42_GIBZE|nr:unnamed protein product [Fusarium graminearum]CEF77780.1 unnamed protein product [Fusarium graminearum]CZS81075.1 unnamed protein product [Fusarium graminearum]
MRAIEKSQDTEIRAKNKLKIRKHGHCSETTVASDPLLSNLKTQIKTSGGCKQLGSLSSPLSLLAIITL